MKRSARSDLPRRAACRWWSSSTTIPPGARRSRSGRSNRNGIWWLPTRFTAARRPAARPAGTSRASARRRGSGLGCRGTPMPHSPLDVYGYFRFIDATIFGWSYNRFRQHFAVMGGYQNHQVVAYDNLDELNRKFYSVTFACGKDVLDLPPEVHITYTCQLGGEARRTYRSLKRNLMARTGCRGSHRGERPREAAPSAADHRRATFAPTTGRMCRSTPRR